MRLGALVLVGFALVVAGGGSQTASAKQSRTAMHAGKPYRLYTHCGIQWARIHGSFWRVTRPLSDGSGNPPPGWGNPFQDGTLTMASRTTANFTSPAGSVVFRRTKRHHPPLVCS
jgi:hypothetical protein